MAALAHSHGDEPLDPAEEPMPAAAFEIIQRAHQLCDHAPAVDLAADLKQRAEQARSEAQAILSELAAESLTEATPIFPPENSGNSPPPAEPTDVKPLVPDWKQAAQDAWHGESWAQAAAEYQVKRGKRRTIVESEPEKLRRLRGVRR
jgi:hypothetical protein